MKTLLILGGLALLMFQRQSRTYPVAGTVRNQTSKLQAQANRVAATTDSLAVSIDRMSGAVGSISRSVSTVVDSLGRALNVGNASLSEYGGDTTRTPLYAGGDPFMVSGGINWSADYIIADEGSGNVLDPSFYDPTLTVNA